MTAPRAAARSRAGNDMGVLQGPGARMTVCYRLMRIAPPISDRANCLENAVIAQGVWRGYVAGASCQSRGRQGDGRRTSGLLNDASLTARNLLGTGDASVLLAGESDGELASLPHTRARGRDSAVLELDQLLHER